jgi:hypothetical protein
MSEIAANPRYISINLPAPEGVRTEQTSSRGDGSIELGEEFARDSIDFSRVVDHLGIHTDGAIAGSQFNGEVFATPEDVIDKVKAALPESLQYDQYGRAELTLTAEGSVIGYSGVKTIRELESIGGVHIERAMRMPGGEAAEVEGVKGAWFPEMALNPKTGKLEIATDSEGMAKNQYGKFEPEALIAHVEEPALLQALATDKFTVILQKDPENEQPTALTIFPGENAPAFPAKIETDTQQTDTLQGGPEAVYWAQHAFVQTA